MNHSAQSNLGVNLKSYYHVCLQTFLLHYGSLLPGGLVLWDMFVGSEGGEL